MRRQSRPILVAVLTALLFINPAFACRNCSSNSGGYGGYYSGNYGGYSTGYNYASFGYGGGYGGYYDSCCGSGVVVDEGCSCEGCGCGDCGCGSCGSSDECSGCSSCGGCTSCDGCASCDGGSCEGCSSCGNGGEAVYEDTSESVNAPMLAPEPPVNHAPTMMNNSPVAPTLPPASMPSDHTTEMQPMPPAIPPQTMPAETMPVPPTAEAPADDLFGAPAAESTPPAVEEAPAPTTEPSAPAGGDDLFGAPESSTDSAPAPTTEPTAPTGGDDLFGPAEGTAPVEGTAPTEEAAPPAEEKPAEGEDDLFGDASSTLRQPGGFASLDLRRWKDNTGRHSCRGRLIRVIDGKAQLLKDNGHTTTVAFARLSPEDLAFVNRQASAQRTESLSKTAQADTNR